MIYIRRKNLSNDFIEYANGDGNDTIMGYASSDTIYIASGKYTTTTSGQDVIISVGNGSILLKEAKGKTLNIEGTYAGGSSTSTTSGGGTSTNTSTSTTLTVTNSTKSPVTVGSAIKTINASSRTTAVKIAGNSLANSIVGGSGADSLSGASGADTLNGGKGNDTLIGGAGNDLFIYQSGQGNDVITDYVTGQDKLKITGAKISKSSISGSDVILYVGTGSIKVKNAKGKKLSIYNNSNTLITTVVGGASSTTSSAGSSNSTTLTVTNATRSPVTVGSTIKTINASTRSTAVKITANALANTIRGGSGIDTIYGGSGNDSILGNNGNDKLFGDAGNDTLRGGAGNDSIQGAAGADRLFGDAGNDTLRGGAGNDSIQGAAGADKLFGDAGNDTLSGGKGNDTLTGGAGVDVFVYATGDGNDVITDYTAQDKLRITVSYSTLNSGNDITITVGTGKLTLKNAKGTKLNITKVSNYEERWFTEDDNNFTASDVSSIIKSDNQINSELGIRNSELKNENLFNNSALRITHSALIRDE